MYPYFVESQQKELNSRNSCRGFLYLLISRYNFLAFYSNICDTVWKLWKFRESNVCTKEIIKELIWRNIFFWSGEWIFHFSVKSSHSVKNEKLNCLLLKNISSNQLFSNLFSSIVTFTSFLPKLCIAHSVEKSEIYCHATFFRQINLE